MTPCTGTRQKSLLDNLKRIWHCYHHVLLPAESLDNRGRLPCRAWRWAQFPKMPLGPHVVPNPSGARSHSMADHSNMKLGRKAIKTDSRTLALGNYLKPSLPPPPPAKDWTCGVTEWGMMGNDKLGDCTIAGVA